MATVAENEAATKVRVYHTLYPASFIVSRQSLDMKSIIDEAKVNLQDWNATLQQVRCFIYIQNAQINLSQLKIERKSCEAAFFAMTQNVSARLDVRSRRSKYLV